MRLRYAESALADLDAIHEYQTAHWPAARAAFEAKLAAIEKRALQFPNSAPEVAERPGVRVVAFIDFPYRLFYRVNDETIEVLAIRGLRAYAAYDDSLLNPQFPRSAGRRAARAKWRLSP